MKRHSSQPSTEKSPSRSTTRRCRHATGLFVLCLLAGPLSEVSRTQNSQRFSGRLSVLPVDPVTVNSMSGEGHILGTLNDTNLVITGTFTGLSSPATAAHINQAPPARRGQARFTLEVTAGVHGTVTGNVVLSLGQIELLDSHSYYVQIHTENNPDGEIRGWLMPQPSAPAPVRYHGSQALSGKTTYRNVCASCHQRDLAGGFDAPELAGPDFMAMWRGRPVHELFDYIKVAMPPAGLKPDDIALTNIVAYILQQNGVNSSASPLVATAPNPIGTSAR